MELLLTEKKKKIINTAGIISVQGNVEITSSENFPENMISL